ncbi:MAG: replicative DNA helicase, partial [Holosporaceae bacterium]|jgi:replicative DNA helicase|nr:replicative DNA helicase [Holosporaceae bacterium]
MAHQRPEREMRVLPYNIEAEQSLLGAIMLNNECFESVSEFLLPLHFYAPLSGRIYEAAGKLIFQGLTADPITLRAYFERDKESPLEGVGDYLVKLIESVVSIAGAADYGKLIYEMYLRRQLISIGENMSYSASTFELGVEAANQIEDAEARLYELSISNRHGGFVPFSTALADTLEVVERAYKSDNSVTGITTGFIDLDKWLGGLNKSDLIILAGRPSMGKTALATNMAFNAAMAYIKKAEGGGKVAFFSLEMSAEQLVSRILSQECAIPSEKIRRGEIKEEDFAKIMNANRRLAELLLFIDDTPALTVSALRTRARKLKRQYGLDLIIVDYLQLLRGSDDKRNENRVQEISEITRLLKALAKELDVPVLALSQLSRAVETRDDKRPQLADLRESGSIEQDADVVMFVYREEYYEARREPTPGTDKHREWMDRMSKVHNLAEVILAKHRHGPIGTIRLFFDGRYTRFDNLSDGRKCG